MGYVAVCVIPLAWCGKMQVSLIEEFLANGGTITKCPPVYLLPSLGAASLNTGIATRIEEENLPWKERKAAKQKASAAYNKAASAAKARSEAMRGTRANAAVQERNDRAKAQRLKRLGDVRKAFDQGQTLEQIGAMDGCSIEQVKKLLRETGVSFAEPKKRVYKPKPMSLRTRDPRHHNHDELVRLYTVELMSINAIAKQMSCSNITVRRACALAGVTRVKGMKAYNPELDARRVEARRLRAEGKSFMAIARIMGKNHETIRGYCLLVEGGE